MTKIEVQWIKDALGAAIAELVHHDLKLPLPYIHKDGKVMLVCETRDGLQYERPICKL